MSCDVNQPTANVNEPLENGEGSARFKVITLRDTRKETQQLKKVNKTLAEHNIELKKRCEEKIEDMKTLQATNDRLITDKINLQAEIKILCNDGIKLASENVFFSFENLKRKLQSGEVRANDNEDGNNRAEGDENSNQVPAELARFLNPFNCEVSCSSSVVLFILYWIGLRLCFRRFMMEVQCTLSKIPEATFEVGKCSLSLDDFSKAGLLELVFHEDITAKCTINDALRKAREEMKGQTNPAVLAMEYEMEPDGTQPVGHSVAIMPGGDCIDVRYGRYWEPKPDNRISRIHVVKVKNSDLVEWQRKCGLQKCEDECITCSSSTESLG